MAVNKLIILNYHQIFEYGEKADLFSVKVNDFLEQMNLLKKLNLPVISLDEVSNGNALDKFNVALSFDDCYHSDYKIVLPILENLKYPATFFPILNKLDTEGRLSTSQLKTISEKGFTVGSHGISHTVLSKMTFSEQESEIINSKVCIEKILNKPATLFAPPYGLFNKKIIQLSKRSGYKLMFSTGLQINSIEKSSYVFYRWNITSKTTIKSIESILNSGGKLPMQVIILTTVKRYIKKVLGVELIDRLIK